MYVEETGAGDGDIKITVEGDEYSAEANYDLDGDGIDDTVTVMTDDGHVAYIDENADGEADLTQTVHGDGVVVSQARFDPASGNWVGEDPGDQTHVPHDQGGAPLVVDAPEGDRQVGPATEDTNQDGRADTAVVETDHGSMLVTDVDGDGSADQMVDVDDAGQVTVTQHTGDGQWTVVEKGRIDQNGQYTPNPAVGATDDATWTFDSDPEQRPRGGPRFTSGGKSGDAPDSDSAWI